MAFHDVRIVAIFMVLSSRGMWLDSDKYPA